MDCHWFNTNHCRSCELLAHTYEETLRIKETKLTNLFPDISQVIKATAGLDAVVAGSRNKAKLAVFSQGEEIQFGFYDNGLNFKDLESCPLHMPELNEILPILKIKLKNFKIIPYSVTDKTGELKYLILSKSESHDEMLLRFVLRSKESLDRLKKMAKILQTEMPSIKVITANFQPEHKAILEGDQEIVLTENTHILNTFGDVNLTLGPRSFFQVTPEIAGKLYQAVGDVVRDLKVNSFLDLFCGVGAFSFFAAKTCPKVYGVEISKEAIECAKKSIALNKIAGEIKFEALDVEEFLKLKKEKYDAILINPPRRGLNASIIQNIMDSDPRVIIYSSCNAETLARDFEIFKMKYVISYAQIYDMFPFTEHFETLMILNRKDA
ncbi:MAG: 23S rRNA (uracil(1939)-C(5))-methyltransferase RlmD [Bacteriovorax sp.]|nr:23S rRNA (uracil(1939)-C(5))-methyltransferase RlmD [Bacteriovorax sp.]